MTKRIVSISLGSSSRDYKREFELGGEKIIVERIGTDGDMERYRQLMEELDGEVDCFGIGGTDLYLRLGERKYKIRDVWKKLVKNVKQSPMVDGGGIKSTLERQIMQYIEQQLPNEVKDDRSTLVTCAVDRFGQALSAWEFVEHNPKLITFGDLLWGFKLGIAIHRMRTVHFIGRMLLPIVSRLPFAWLYPTGEKQEEHKPLHTKYFKRAKFIAGDFLFIKRYMPLEGMEGKIIVTNTTTERDVKMLKELGIKYLVTSTPRVGGRSFGTNVLEAAIVAISGKKGELTTEEYNHYLKELDIKPTIQQLNE